MNGEIDHAISAARSGNAVALREWLAQGGMPNTHDENGWTPLLWAAARGHAEAVRVLLDHPERPADPGLGHRDSRVLAIHVAAQAGSVPCAELLLDAEPRHLNAVYDINGHSPLLQTVFYGHLPLAKRLLERGADTAITTARGLGPLELAAQFQNQPMVELLRPYDRPAEDKTAYYHGFLKRIAPVVPASERVDQDKADRFVSIIGDGLGRTLREPSAALEVLAQVRGMVKEGVDVNRLGGPLQQPPLIVAVTGNNGLPGVPEVAKLRFDIARLLLEHGADPTRHEKHPMGAQTIIRAAVFNHLDILKECAQHMTPQALADAINEYPLVNGLTAMHDTVLRATMAGPDRFDGYLEQARFFVHSGGRVDVEDFSGTTQRDIAERCPKPEARARLLAVLDGKE